MQPDHGSMWRYQATTLELESSSRSLGGTPMAIGKCRFELLIKVPARVPEAFVPSS